MNCPKCNHPTERHIEARLFDCPLTEAQALLSAQRHAAAVELRASSRKWWAACEIGDFWSAIAWAMKTITIQNAIRAFGIQRPRRSEQ